MLVGGVGGLGQGRWLGGVVVDKVGRVLHWGGRVGDGLDGGMGGGWEGSWECTVVLDRLLMMGGDGWLSGGCGLIGAGAWGPCV